MTPLDLAGVSVIAVAFVIAVVVVLQGIITVHRHKLESAYQGELKDIVDQIEVLRRNVESIDKAVTFKRR